MSDSEGVLMCMHNEEINWVIMKYVEICGGV